MKKYFLDTMSGGLCYVAKIDSRRIESFLKKNGWTPAKKLEKADIIIVNTCAYCTEAERRSIQTIKKYKKLKDKKTKLIVGGCLPIINKRKMLTVFKGPFFTPHTLSFLSKIIKAKHYNIDEIPTAQPIITDSSNTISRKEEKVFCIRVGYGCLNRCSFCAVNKVFPKLISKSIEQIIKEFKAGLKYGYQNFIITGEDSSAYGLDIGTNLNELLKKLISIKTKKRINISLYRLNPRWLIKMGLDFIKILKSKKINYLSIPINSGSDRILKLMNRGHKAKEVKDYIKKIKKTLFIKINYDIMVGFPGETEKDFKDTLRFVLETKPNNIRVFLYTDRPGAKAKYLGKKILPEIMKKRAEQLYKTAGLTWQPQFKK